ncbi:hypothetical protein [Thermincola potens]|uniref:Uncharacterized protein n=1 Tax=Thermincola potens (strain JR) TaxID=635013 RepID=D5XCD6_THEPJ|nr:hypothetical protein [Thermincola potens]ADG83588.1 hypothetical protein TherJR_2755 [Thermincola potens JR]
MSILLSHLLVNFCLTFLVAFLLLYPFHIRDYDPKRHLELWLWIRAFFKNKSGAVSGIIMFSAIGIFEAIIMGTQNIPFGVITVLIWISFVGGVFRYPYYLKHKKPEKYKGFWKTIGEWLSESPSNEGKKR